MITRIEKPITFTLSHLLSFSTWLIYNVKTDQLLKTSTGGLLSYVLSKLYDVTFQNSERNVVSPYLPVSFIL